ncbi:50S ribosomal protein L27 [Candidatus Jorgensenbacteria bacterium CG_4_10_14_0_8_um_filter_39_13]|uniref:Large ribosomal subunit protein bL27 n=2 Tax=Candidatus Joergenseniibacteriota TaxID=1752739 RepID=A0A2M7RH72_9BACT|nr:MAG: 50S ribosomal protein L27 [Candidatus Jorgensenbacteria bacterium CG11_big_fil_rev_8_21_14_0_20_38_23]PIV13421.1 MAG: 50S ribosomal protein L27 [Candidatus Jorgensenbacteria bacterium CG03_land_8_20_14_0_80_38_39]PIW97653.1 MAG: 50S ribosomal protein L27 [Candidatus Jorgensenbacteria bacterium CG_4_8_14_3_um_filter_38_10]PIY96073.1 MAG: 50S ribosomal protein L27 [Candidatus Jorgensenbacteria bacterium CG_4_10_14_0_8_um_filter_39_13]PJA95219.1 MAG: 50S ribosomal protein L27 [Candidatus J
MAHTKAKGSSKLGRESESKRLGVKKSDGSIIKAGEIIIRQRGTHYVPGQNVKKGGDDTLYALKSGKVKFLNRKHICFNGNKKFVKVVAVQ